MSDEEIDKFLKSNKAFSIPQFQDNFKIGYLSAKQHIDRLVKEGMIEYCDGLYHSNIQSDNAVTGEVNSSINKTENIYERLTRAQEERIADEERRFRNLFRKRKIEDNEDLKKDISRTFDNDFGQFAYEIRDYEFMFNLNNMSDTCMPEHSLWDDEEEFSKAVVLRFARLVRSDYKMARSGAVKKAGLYLQAVKDTSDRKMVQVYERLVYILKIMSNYSYNKNRTQLKNI
ncbi:MAG: hypothetical protein K2L12_08490 [Clostridia bacterium]|nr:hypothetical protein [Clostridia bacterium]